MNAKISEDDWKSVHHVQLAMPAEAEDECRAFYGGVLGLKELEKPPELVGRGGFWMKAGDVEIHLGVEEDFKPARKARPALVVHDLEKVADVLTKAGREVQWDEKIPGVSRFFTFDPVGNRIEIIG